MGNRRDNGFVQWWKDPPVVAALASIGGGVVAFCISAHIVIPYAAHEIAGMGAGGLAVWGGGSYLYRRIRAVMDPDNDAPTVTLRKTDPTEPNSRLP